MRRVMLSFAFMVFLGLGWIISIQSDALARTISDLLVHPYIGETTSSSVVISWATGSPGEGEIRYSLDQSYGSTVSARSIEYDGKTWYSTKITGLMPGTEYYYKVYIEGQDVSPWMKMSFKTSPEYTESKLSFVAFGDSRPNNLSAPPMSGSFGSGSRDETTQF